MVESFVPPTTYFNVVTNAELQANPVLHLLGNDINIILMNASAFIAR